MENEPTIEDSPLSQPVTSGGRTVNVEIYRLKGDEKWSLEVVDENGNSTVWDELFESDSKALVKAKETILAEGIDSLIGPASGKGEWK
ncbi:MAG: hypothetical protein K1562_15790 [Candidatus Thiodiazotropha sp. (ex. Lucinisca nassula)]|nr:hypothetical protein [Candidatus Thiodiazotropha sp. (ex. Lucinisca nassula)]